MGIPLTALGTASDPAEPASASNLIKRCGVQLWGARFGVARAWHSPAGTLRTVRGTARDLAEPASRGSGSKLFLLSGRALPTETKVERGTSQEKVEPLLTQVAVVISAKCMGTARPSLSDTISIAAHPCIADGVC